MSDMRHATQTQARHAYWLNWICPLLYRPPVVRLSKINDQRRGGRERERRARGVGSTMEMVMSVRPVERVLNILRLCSRFARSFCAAESISNSLARSQQRRRIQHPIIKWERRAHVHARMYSPAIQSLPVVIGYHVGPSGEGGRPPRTQQAFLQLAHVGEPSTTRGVHREKGQKWVPTRRPPRSASSTCASTRVGVG